MRLNLGSQETPHRLVPSGGVAAWRRGGRCRTLSVCRCPSSSGLVLVTFVDDTVVLLVIEPWMGLYTADGMLNGHSVYVLVRHGAVVLHALHTHGPRPSPSKYAPELESGSSDLQEGKRDGGEPRFCHKCGCHKPPRTHHCRVCKRCVLRMVRCTLPLNPVRGLMVASLPSLSNSCMPRVPHKLAAYTEAMVHVAWSTLASLNQRGCCCAHCRTAIVYG